MHDGIVIILVVTIALLLLHHDHRLRELEREKTSWWDEHVRALPKPDGQGDRPTW